MSRRGAVDIAIVGAGVVGATLALALARQGWRVALVEAREARAWSASADADLRVFAISPASAQLFDSVDVWQAVCAARVQPYRHMHVWDAAGGAPLHFDAGASGQPALGWIVEQALLQHALWQSLSATTAAGAAGIAQYCPDALEQFDQDEQGATLTLASGARIHAALAIAADGADSPLRALAGIEVERRDHGQRAVVAFVQTEYAHQDTAWQRFLPTGPLAFLPFADGRSSIVWTLPELEAARVLELSDEAFLRELERGFDARLGAISACSPRAAFPLRRQIARQFLQGRVLLVGDAARVVHPLAGQGVNLGLQDVRAFAAALGTRADQPPVRGAGSRAQQELPLAALRRAARARRSDSTIAAFAFDAINAGFSNDHLLPTLLRGPALGLVDRLSPLKRFLADHAAGWR